MDEPLDAISELIGIVKILRGPEGCGWDRSQTAESLRPYMLEEAYEVADAVEAGDWHALESELGDLLLHVLMTAEICESEGRFTVGDVARSISEKLMRRHPHVFDSPGSLSPEEVEKQWEAIKAEEKREEGFFASIPPSMPSLLTAWRILQRASEIGFEWESPDQARDKVLEELSELRIAVEGGDREAQEEEIGDLLFSLANYCRMNGFEPEAILRSANRKFMIRFGTMESILHEEGETLKSATLEQMLSAWNRSH